MLKISSWTHYLDLQYSKDQALDYLFLGNRDNLSRLRSSIQLTTICHHIRSLYLKLIDDSSLSDENLNIILYLISESKAAVSHLTSVKDYQHFDSSNKWWREKIMPYDSHLQEDFYGIKAGSTFRKTSGFDKDQFRLASSLLTAKPSRFYSELASLDSSYPYPGEISYLIHAIAWLRYRIELKIINSESKLSVIYRIRQRLSFLFISLFRSLRERMSSILLDSPFR